MYDTYQIKAGDTLENIAQSLGITVNILREINGLSTNHRLTPGEVIVVPVSNKGPFRSYTVKTGDTMYGIANRFGIPLDTLLQVNGLNKDDYIYPNQEILVPRENSNFYVTKEASTIDDVVKALKTTKQDFVNQNAVIYLQPDQLFYSQNN